MAKGSGRLASDFDIDETGGVLSGLLAEEEELDRSALWRLGTWAALSIGAVIVALITNQSSIGMRREQTASAELLRQTQQVQIAARETQSEARRLASAIETLNGDRDRLYSRVAVLEQGLDSVTGAIARQNSSPPSSSAQASAAPAITTPATTSPVITTSQAATSPGSASPVAATAASPSATPSSSSTPTASASTAPASTASVDPPPVTPKPTPAPTVAPVAATAAAVADKPASARTASEPSPTVASLSAQKPVEAAQASGSLMASKSIMAPPDPAAGKLIEAAAPPKTVTSAPMPEVAAVATTTPEEAEPDSAAKAPELLVKRTEFGVDVGGANSLPGLRALWRGLLKSRSNAALTTLRPIIVIKENGNGLGMQLRLVAGPISDAAAAAKICASLTMNDRSCTTAVFEGQRLAMSADEQVKPETSKPDTNKTDTSSVDNSEPTPVAPKSSYRRRSAAKHPVIREEAPKPERSTLSLIFGKR
jgi:hypothetical protein